MTIHSLTQPSPMRRPMLWLGTSFLVGLGMVLLLAVGWMGAPRQDVMDLGIYLVVSGLISVGCGAGAVIWLRRGHGRLWQQVALAFSVGIGIAILNVLLTARLMFISADHDLILLVLLLLYAAVVSLTLGYTVAHTLAERATAICEGARSLSAGDLTARVPAQGSDELANLAMEFNTMADRLAASDRERHRLELARRELIAAISHDLRTPLASVQAMVEALSDGVVDDPATVQRYLSTMRGQIGHLSGLIDDLFELSQIDAGALRLDFQLVSPADLASDAVEALQAQAAPRGVQLRAEIGDGLPRIRCAPQKIERVIYNLVSNAIRHTQAEGEIVVRVGDGQWTIDGGRWQGRVVFEVADTGEGIAPEDLPYVFDRFYRGEKSRSRATGGAGLGLAIARGIIEAHGGQIEIESTPGHGTTVRFSLPR